MLNVFSTSAFFVPLLLWCARRSPRSPVGSYTRNSFWVVEVGGLLGPGEKTLRMRDVEE